MDNPAECQEILRKYGYPLDKQEKATQTVFEQAELVATDWVAIEKEPGEIQRHRLKSGPKKRDRYETYPQRHQMAVRLDPGFRSNEDAHAQPLTTSGLFRLGVNGQVASLEPSAGIR